VDNIRKDSRCRELDTIEAEALEEAREARKKGWEMFQKPIKTERDALVKIINDRTCKCAEDAREASSMRLRVT
jgi:hypothetical protein